jgi:hypothetical protein
MRLEELVEKDYTAKISVYLDDVKDEDKGEVAGMLRGLMCALDGYAPLSGLTNDVMSQEGPVVLRFSSVEKAHYFKSCVEYYFSPQVLEALKVKKRFRST